MVQQARGFLLLTGVWLTLGRLELGGWDHSQARHPSPHQDLSGPKRAKVTLLPPLPHRSPLPPLQLLTSAVRLELALLSQDPWKVWPAMPGLVAAVPGPAPSGFSARPTWGLWVPGLSTTDVSSPSPLCPAWFPP